jgi:hypothetical protein
MLDQVAAMDEDLCRFAACFHLLMPAVLGDTAGNLTLESSKWHHLGGSA